MHCLVAIIKSLGHQEAGLTGPPQAHVQSSALLWLYGMYVYNGEKRSRTDAVREARDAIYHASPAQLNRCATLVFEAHIEQGCNPLIASPQTGSCQSIIVTWLLGFYMVLSQ